MNGGIKDGLTFIREEVKEGLLNWFSDVETQKLGRIHIAMNLPASAISFLNVFVSMLKEDEKQLRILSQDVLPLVHVYAFSKANNPKDDLRVECEKQLGRTLDNIQIRFVRNVAPNKDMFRITIPLTLDILCDTCELKTVTSKNKRQKLS